jgi:hypothetical protein
VNASSGGSASRSATPGGCQVDAKADVDLVHQDLDPAAAGPVPHPRIGAGAIAGRLHISQSRVSRLLDQAVERIVHTWRYYPQPGRQCVGAPASASFLDKLIMN